jgi:hypothetical protein
MGHKRVVKIRKLIFEDPEMEGLEVRVRKPSMGILVKAAALQGVRLGPDQFTDLLTDFAACLESWNREDEDGEPVPATLEGLLTEEDDFLGEVIDAWITTLSGVDAPLEKPSGDGDPSLVASIPMAPLSASQAS